MKAVMSTLRITLPSMNSITFQFPISAYDANRDKKRERKISKPQQEKIRIHRVSPENPKLLELQKPSVTESASVVWALKQKAMKANRQKQTWSLQGRLKILGLEGRRKVSKRLTTSPLNPWFLEFSSILLKQVLWYPLPSQSYPNRNRKYTK